jgi:DNA-binding MarR family transcriptional regulator
MVEEELVTRVADRDDSRAWLIVVSDKGEKALAAWRAQLAETLRPWFGELDAADWATLAATASLLESRLGADSAAVAS